MQFKRKTGSNANVLHYFSGLLLILLCSAGMATAPFSDPITTEDFDLPPQDEQGWSILVPSSSSRLVYVDASGGDDSTAVVYSPDDSEIGPDPKHPLGSIQAFQTLSAAQDELRHDQPDWILLRSGEIWEESLDLRRGLSPQERQVASYWGEGPRPELRTGAEKGLANSQLTNAAIVGIRFWAHTRDPEGPYFTDYEGSSGFSLFSRNPGDPRQVRDILIEDCHFHSYRGNGLTSHYDDGAEPILRFVIRRSIISRNFSTDSHSQGFWFGANGQPLAPAILLEENLFDHNGWRVQQVDGGNDTSDGQATMFNHNTYFARASGVIFKRNIFMRASSIGNKWTAYSDGRSQGVVLDDNLYLDGEIGISMGGNSPYGPLRFQDIIIRDNVFTDIGRSRPTDRGLSWGLEVFDWDNGLVDNNLFVHQRDTDITNTWALRVNNDETTHTRDVLLRNNVIANLFAGGSSSPLRLVYGEYAENVQWVDNIVHSNITNPAVWLAPGGYSFGGTNHYHTQRSPDSRFRINSDHVDLSTWISTTQDSGATLDDPAFPDPDRTIEGYVSLQGLGSTYEDFIDAVYEQSRSNWNPALGAGAINEWFRQGYGMSKGGGQAPLIFHDRFQEP